MLPLDLSVLLDGIAEVSQDQDCIVASLTQDSREAFRSSGSLSGRFRKRDRRQDRGTDRS